nr:unnamed protein product [Digitaria exilis]
MVGLGCLPLRRHYHAVTTPACANHQHHHAVDSGLEQSSTGEKSMKTPSASSPSTTTQSREAGARSLDDTKPRAAVHLEQNRERKPPRACAVLCCFVTTSPPPSLDLTFSSPR